MNLFWSIYVGVLVILTMGLALLLYFYGTRVKIPIDDKGTSGHSWDNGGLREAVHRLPRWWAIMSLTMFVWGIGYLVLFPGFGNYKGLLHWTSAQQVAGAQGENAAKLDAMFARYRPFSVDKLADDATAQQYGHRLFQDNCAACHGPKAEGGQGFPALTVNGDDGDFVVATVMSGRNGVMPPWGPVLGEQGVNEVANYVLSLSGESHDTALATAGEPKFKETCGACHGASGKGTKALGAPDLTDHSWIYGGDLASVKTTISNGRSGHMPAWKDRLGEDQIRLVAAWVRHNALQQRAVNQENVVARSP